MTERNLMYFTDGAATMKKENGKYVRCAGGWGWILLDEAGENIIAEDSGGLKSTTNNEMELMAIREALLHACREAKQCDMVYIHSDSAYCINIFTQWIKGWQANGWTRGKKHEPIENLELIKEIWDIVTYSLENSFIGVRWVKVKGHSTNKFNNYVDNLAVTAKMSQANA